MIIDHGYNGGRGFKWEGGQEGGREDGRWYACVVWGGVWVDGSGYEGEVGLDKMEVGVVVEEEMEWQGTMVCLCLYVWY